MAILTAETTFTVEDASVAVASVDLLVLPVATVGEGSGRLKHPDLGAYDYEIVPDEWTNVLGDAVVPPIWASQATLGGAANTLWEGKLRDVVVEERWLAEAGLSMPLSQLEFLLSAWMSPPDPQHGYVQWFPSYANGLGFDVILLGLTSGGQELTLDHLALREKFVPYPVTLKMRLVGRVR